MDVKFVIIFSFVTFTHNVCNVKASGCNWDLNKDIPKNDPLYLNPESKFELLHPNASGISLETGEKIALACSGKSNVITDIGLKEIIATCDDDELIFNNKNYTLKSLKCNDPVFSVIETEGYYCPNIPTAPLYKIGFNTTFGMLSLIEVCYDKNNETAFYSKHTIMGNSLNASEKDSYRPYFRPQGLAEEKETPYLYKRKGQLRRFAELFGTNLTEQYITNKNYLSRGHLAPDGDFIFGSWSYASYYYVNVAPQWQSINGGNWQKIESMIRKLAIRRRANLHIYTGNHDVLQLPDEFGDLITIYLLDGDRLPVPKWYWKVVYQPEKQDGIALLTLNNPYAEQISDDEIPCKDICKETKWFRSLWTNFRSGYTICCNVEEISTVVNTLPQLNVSRNFFGPY